MRALVFVAMMVMLARAATLDDLLATATKLRKLDKDAEKPPDQTTFKHQLRDWIESRLPLGVTGEQLMMDVKAAGLEAPDDVWEMAFGYVAGIEVTRPENFPNAVAITTGVSVNCGSDDSLYVYVLTVSGWKRILDYERDTALILSGIEVSPPDPEGGHLVLVTGSYPSCASRFNAIAYRAFRVSPFYPARTLLDGNREMDRHEDRNATLTNSEILIEFRYCCSEQNLTNRTVILKYKLDGDRTTRIDPIALNPQDFVDEWVHQPWTEMRNWTAKDSRTRLEKWHRETGGDKWILPEFTFVQRCSRAGQWQIAAAELEGERTYYFLVSESTGGRYEMLDVSTKRQPGCPGETPPDFTIRSVFSKTPERR